MIESTGINRLVYHFFEARILCGYYTYGENLPPISKICTMFGMAPATVRLALAQLEKKKYIQVDARKAPKVIYRALPDEIRKNTAVYLLQREKGIADMIHTGSYLFGNLWEAGLRQWDKEALEQLWTALTNPAQGMVPMPIAFYILALTGLNNGLITNLYWDIIQYLMFPYLENHDEEEMFPQEISGRSVDDMVAVLHQVFARMNEQATDQVFDFIDTVRKEFPEMEQIPFEWTIYRQRPQIRYTFVSKLIREIMSGKYPAGSYLPSLPQMAQQYGVAVSTVRRALTMLDSLGFVRSYHGKGTAVCMHLDHFDCSGKDIREGMRLYRESLELLTLTIGPVSQYMLASLSEEKRTALLNLFDEIHREGKSYLCFERYLVFIHSECPSALIRECFSRILELLAWGYPFALEKRKDQNLHLEYDQFVSEAVECLRNNKNAVFSENWTRLMEEEKQQFSDEYGI